MTEASSRCATWPASTRPRSPRNSASRPQESGRVWLACSTASGRTLAMTDRTTFEARLIESLDRYADRMPVIVDARQMTRDVAQDHAAPGISVRQWSLPRPSIRVVLLVGLLVALLVGSVLVVGWLAPAPRPIPLNGRVMVTTHGETTGI